MSDQAILRFAAPDNCGECPIRYGDDEHVEDFCCCITNSYVGAFSEERHPDCPLEIVPEMPEGELKPCPFCGGKARADYVDLVQQREIHWYVYCTSCHTKTERFTDKDSYENAIAAWNKREEKNNGKAERRINAMKGNG